MVLETLKPEGFRQSNLSSFSFLCFYPKQILGEASVCVWGGEGRGNKALNKLKVKSKPLEEILQNFVMKIAKTCD